MVKCLRACTHYSFARQKNRLGWPEFALVKKSKARSSAGVGKTTAIREIARLLADECRKRVVLVDTSNEIGGDGDIPHHGVGTARRMQVGFRI